MIDRFIDWVWYKFFRGPPTARVIEQRRREWEAITGRKLP